MPRWEGKYYDEDGVTQTAVVEADNKYDARNQIREMGGITQLKQVRDTTPTTAELEDDQDAPQPDPPSPDPATDAGAGGEGADPEPEAA